MNYAKRENKRRKIEKIIFSVRAHSSEHPELKKKKKSDQYFAIYLYNREEFILFYLS